MFIDDKKMMECIDIKSVTKEHITFNVDGEKLVKEIYENLKIGLSEDELIPIRLTFQDAPFIEIYPNEMFTMDDCQELAVKIRDKLNSQIRAKLKIKE